MAAGNLMRSHSFKMTLVAMIAFVLGVVIAGTVSFFYYQNLSSSSTLKPIRESNLNPNAGYIFTNPLIALSGSNNNSADYVGLEQSVESYIASQESNGLSSASVSFRDLLQNEAFTVNPTELYYPASLEKVPLMMAYYSLGEENSSILSQELYYSGAQDLNSVEQIKSPIQLTPGTSYTVQELIEHMILYSDNNATQLLLTNLSNTNNLGVLTSLFKNLGLNLDDLYQNQPSDYLTVKSYSLFLRVLYNATYLNQDDSEKALKLMSETDFTNGMESGVPNGILVSQKFGESKIDNPQGNLIGAELHNCGIIYYPNHPYLLCVMTKGDNIPDLEQSIAGISRIIYQNIEHRYPDTGF